MPSRAPGHGAWFLAAALAVFALALLAPSLRLVAGGIAFALLFFAASAFSVAGQTASAPARPASRAIRHR